MFQTKFVEKIKTQISTTIKIFPKIITFLDNKEYFVVLQATDNNTIWHVRIEYWITEATEVH
jgi:hypothetical protein